MTDNLRRALALPPLDLRCACGARAFFWCANCDQATCSTCSSRGFHAVCHAVVRSIGALRLDRSESC